MDKDLDFEKAVQLLIDLIEEQEKVEIKYQIKDVRQELNPQKNGDNRT